MITLHTNFKIVFARIFILILCAVLLYLILTHLGAESNDNGVWILYFMCLLLAYLIISGMLSLCGIIKVEANEKTDQITFTRFFSKKTISISDIAAYYISFSPSRTGTFYGRIIKTTDKKIIELKAGNLLNVADIDEILKKPGIKYLGEKRSFYPLTRGL